MMAARWFGRVITFLMCVAVCVEGYPSRSVDLTDSFLFFSKNSGSINSSGNINSGFNDLHVRFDQHEVHNANDEPKDKTNAIGLNQTAETMVTFPGNCQPSRTKVRGGSACSGQTLFEDNFDTLNESVWQIEQYIPNTHPEHPFVSYQHLTTGQISTAGGILQITPKLQQDLPGFTNDTITSGTLNLNSGCTSSENRCEMKVDGADILPPVASGRITSKTFAFTYGKVYVRAKLPQGDWLYPEILLEPFLKKYGSPHYSSGVIKIATARGNRQLYYGQNDYSNKMLYGGPIMDLECRETFLFTKRRRDGSAWGDDFHVYSLEWTPEHIVLAVDDEEWGRVEPTGSGLQGQFPSYCEELPQSQLRAGSPMAPFDDHFYLILGVAAGSITEFPDDSITSDNKRKPWRNGGRKAMLNFWQDTDSWLSTWKLSRLEIDYVKVVAL